MPMTNGQIVNAVKECIAEVEAELPASWAPNTGTANFDLAMLTLAHPRPTLARALNEAGIHAEWRTFRFNGRGYAIYGWPNSNRFGNGGVWTGMCGSLAEKLTARGIPAHVCYRMD